MLSRRGIFGALGLAVPVALVPRVEAKPPAAPLPKQSFPKGQIMPRVRHYAVPAHMHTISDPVHSHGYTQSVAVREIDYEIFDGTKFVPLESVAGQRVVADLS
jgi:hypothetical protein